MFGTMYVVFNDGLTRIVVSSEEHGTPGVVALSAEEWRDSDCEWVPVPMVNMWFNADLIVRIGIAAQILINASEK